MPRRVKRRRTVRTDDGLPITQEEYYDYVFPDEGGAAPGLKLLEAAYKWKRMRAAVQQPEQEEEEEGQRASSQEPVRD